MDQNLSRIEILSSLRISLEKPPQSAISSRPSSLILRSSIETLSLKSSLPVIRLGLPSWPKICNLRADALMTTDVTNTRLAQVKSPTKNLRRSNCTQIPAKKTSRQETCQVAGPPQSVQMALGLKKVWEKTAGNSYNFLAPKTLVQKSSILTTVLNSWESDAEGSMI